MKICPVCNSRAFDGAEVCYGCLHRFEEGEEAPEAPQPHTEATVSENPKEMPPIFSIRFTPEADETGGMTWNCAVEVA